MYFLDKRADDRPKSPAAASEVERVPQETPQREVEKSTEGVAVAAHGILSCQTVLAMSNLVF